MIETDLMKLFQFEASRNVLNVRLFRRNIVNARTAAGWHAKAGIKGQCDLYGIGCCGRHVEIETKARRGRLSPEQEAWRDWCREWQVPWIQLVEWKDETPEMTAARWVSELIHETRSWT